MDNHGDSPLPVDRSDRVQRLVAAARRIAPLAAAASKAIRQLAIGGALAAVAIALLLLEPVGSNNAWRWLAGIVVLAALLAPAAVLVVFDQALRDLRDLPARLRTLPELALAQRYELTRLASEIQASGGLSKTGAIRALWSLGRALLPVWELVTGVVPTARLLLPPFGLLAFVAAAVCLLEIVVAVVVVLVELTN